MILGYARVSTVQQNEARQIEALTKAGAEVIFTDKQSGKDFERKRYKHLLRTAKKGDILIIQSIDMLGRSYKDVIEQWQKITRKGIDIKVIDMPLLDTTKNKDLLGTFISDLILQILSYVADTERTLIKKRQAEGIAAAKARGMKFGRPIKHSVEKYEDAFWQYQNKEISRAEFCEKYDISEKTFYRILRKWREANGLCKHQWKKSG